MKNPDMMIQINLGEGEVLICTLRKFAEANADDMPAEADDIADHLMYHDEFVFGGGAGPLCIITHAPA